MRALVIHESLTGNTKEAARQIVADLVAEDWDATECSSRKVDLSALQRADVVIVGTWVDGLILFGQRPGGAGNLAKLPLLGGKPTYLYVTYAVDPGRTLDKLTAEITDRRGDVRGGMAIKRGKLDEGCAEFVSRLLADAPEAVTAGPEPVEAAVVETAPVDAAVAEPETVES